MGKNHIVRESKYSTNFEDEDEDDDDEEEEKLIQTKKSLRQMEGIEYMRQAMLNYVDHAALPLCDYLDFNAVEDFVDYLIQS